MTATTLPEDLKNFRTAWMAKVGLSAGDVGTLPDASHKSGGGYHCGVQDIKDIGKYPTLDYSTRQPRDRVGGNACSAMDTGLTWGRGGQVAAIRFNNLLVQQLIAQDPTLAALRGVNFTPDGQVKRRYDSNNPSQGIIPSTDTVLWHTHFEWWRNTSNTVARQQSFNRLLQLAEAAIQNQSIAGGSGMTTLDSIHNPPWGDGQPRTLAQLIWEDFDLNRYKYEETATQFPNGLAAAVKRIEGKVGGEIPPFTQAQINAAVKAAMLDPEVVAVLAEAAFKGAQQAEKE